MPTSLCISPAIFCCWQVQRLVQQQGVDVNAACDPQGRTALHAAAEHGHHICCSALLELGADSYQYDSRQVSALMLAAMHGHERVIKVCTGFESLNYRSLWNLSSLATVHLRELR
jgi:ankyrin repeat protein